MMTESSYRNCKCNRCGHEWTARTPWDWFRTNPKKKHVPARCASCRSPYWNKPYVRNNLNRAPGSIGFQPALPLPSHDADTVRTKQISRAKKSRVARAKSKRG